MRTIGLIGGTSWVSTIEYYRIINSEINKRRGGMSSARIVLNSVDFGVVDALQKKSDFGGVASLLAEAARQVESGGADCVLLCANTTHMYADQVQAAISVPLIHLIDVTSAAITRAGIPKVGLLGTRLTMERDFYAERLRANGIEAIVPDQQTREFINTMIEQQLVQSVFLPETRDRFLAIIRGLAACGAGGVILGCTEIPLLVEPKLTPIPAFDTTYLHAMAAVEFALSE